MSPAATKDQIADRVTEALVSFGAEPDRIVRDAEFTALDVDSLDLVELAQVVEEEYGVRLTDEDLKDLTTVGQAIDLIAERTASS